MINLKTLLRRRKSQYWFRRCNHSVYKGRKRYYRYFLNGVRYAWLEKCQGSKKEFQDLLKWIKKQDRLKK